MKKILIIEDDKTLSEAIKIALENAGFDTIQALDGEEGLAEAKTNDFDLIILDLILPKKDGYHVLCDLHNSKITKKTPVIILTVIDSAVSNIECEAYGAIDYIVKSELTIQEIVARVKKTINKHQESE